MEHRTWKRLAAVVLAGGVAVVAGVPPAGAAAPPTRRDVGIVDSSVPAAVRVGDEYTTFTITVVTGEVMAHMDTTLLDDRDHRVGGGQAFSSSGGRPTFFKPWVDVYAENLTSWGEHRILVEGLRFDA